MRMLLIVKSRAGGERSKKEISLGKLSSFSEFN
jgi:hypothetical protein